MERKREGTHAIPGFASACTENGIELPVLDITHPRSAAVTDEERMADLKRESIERMQALAGMSDDQKRAYHEQLSNSLILGPVFMADPNANYLSGMSTYVYKLGPDLIGGEKEREFDREVSMGIGGLSVRLRLRDVCRLQADLLIPQLESFPGKDLCFVNIAGGAASDSLNTLCLILEEHPGLLRQRKIEINVLDIDTLSLRFAGRCVEALKQPTRYFHSLDVTLNQIHHDWKDTDALIDLLSRKKQCVVLCASEGGLFEYGTDQDIIRNLNALHDHSPEA